MEAIPERNRLLASIYQSSLHDFVRGAWHVIESVPFVDSWHVGCICEHLQAVTRGDIPRLLINIPPGCSKSLLVSVFWPMWEWSVDPSIRWFFASYDQRLSTRDSVKCRSLIQAEWFRVFWGDKFSFVSDQNQKTYFQTNRGGYRLATSVGGHGTGEHPDRIVIDDPHNVKKAESETERQNVIDWWDLTMSTRGAARDARRVIIMQRLHTNDLSGHVLKQGGWEHIVLPMRYEADRMRVTSIGWVDPRTVSGELLCPQLFDEEKVGQIEKPLGIYGVAGQMQQRPAPLGGGMFRSWFFNQRALAAPYHAKRIRYWDRAALAEGLGGCNTVGTLMAKSHDGNYFVEDVVVGQWEPDERDAMIVATALKDRLRYGPNNIPIVYIEHEPGSSGVDAYKATAKKLAGFVVFPDRPTGAKDVRAEPWASQCGARNVYIVETGKWDVQEWIDEHLAFPRGARLDRVDSAAGAFNKLAAMRMDTSVKILRQGSFTKGRTPNLVALSREELVLFDVESHQCLVIWACDPPVEKSSANNVVLVAAPTTNGQEEHHEIKQDERTPGNGPPALVHSLTKLSDINRVEFADIVPADYQDAWDAPVPVYNKTPSEILMTEQHGKKVWASITKKRDPAVEVLVFVDEGHGDRRALSLALGVARVMRLKDSAVFRPSHEDNTVLPDEVNTHITSIIQATRAMVV